MAYSLAPSSANAGSLHGDVSGSGGSTGLQKDRLPAAPSGRAAPRGRQRLPVRQRSVSRVATEPRPWASLLANGGQRQTPLDLSFVEPVIHGDAKTAIYDDSTSAEIVEAWQYAVMGYCVGLKPSYTTLSQFLQRAWRPKGHVDVLMREGGFFICVFNLEEDMHAAIEGFWALRGHPLILRKWSPDLEMEKERLTSIPVWVRFPSLPLAWWSTRGLSQISSLIGRPLRMDQLTASRKRLQYARVCILIEVGNDMPRSVTVINSKGISEEISVHYEWIPKVCHHCNLFGHNASECLRKGNTERSDKSAGSAPTKHALHHPVERIGGGSNANPPRAGAPDSKQERRATVGGVPDGHGRKIQVAGLEAGTVSDVAPRDPVDFGDSAPGATRDKSYAAAGTPLAGSNGAASNSAPPCAQLGAERDFSAPGATRAKPNASATTPLAGSKVAASNSAPTNAQRVAESANPVTLSANSTSVGLFKPAGSKIAASKPTNSHAEKTTAGYSYFGAESSFADSAACNAALAGGKSSGSTLMVDVGAQPFATSSLPPVFSAGPNNMKEAREIQTATTFIISDASSPPEPAHLQHFGNAGDFVSQSDVPKVQPQHAVAFIEQSKEAASLTGHGRTKHREDILMAVGGEGVSHRATSFQEQLRQVESRGKSHQLSISK